MQINLIPKSIFLIKNSFGKTVIQRFGLIKELSSNMVEVDKSLCKQYPNILV